jgi:ATP-dependent helicase HrpB
LIRIVRPPRQSLSLHENGDNALLLSLLSGFPDRVARRRIGNQVLLANGVSAEIAGEVPPYEFMLALDAEDRTENPLPLIRIAARIEPEWLLDVVPNRVQEQTTIVWNRTSERVEQVGALVYDKLVLEESRGNASEADAAELLAKKALETGIEQFTDKDALEAFLARLAFAGSKAPDLEAVLRDLCIGLHSFADLRGVAKNFMPLLEQTANARLLNDSAPLAIRLGNGRMTTVNYEHDRPPWIASRLQDFFGMHETPRIGPEKTPLVIHLLAPNQRAVQTTTDLAGFWERLYPQVRRELMRRYPRHPWPEKP